MTADRVGQLIGIALGLTASGDDIYQVGIVARDAFHDSLSQEGISRAKATTVIYPISYPRGRTFLSTEDVETKHVDYIFNRDLQPAFGPDIQEKLSKTTFGGSYSTTGPFEITRDFPSFHVVCLLLSPISHTRTSQR